MRHIYFRFGIVLLTASFFVAHAADIPPNPDKVTLGMERGSWSVEGWGNSGAAERVSFSDRKILKLIYSDDGKEKASFKHVTYMGLDPQGNVSLFIYAPDEKSPQVALAISTTRAFRWHESKPRTLKQGWNKIEFPVGGKVWKTEASNWQYTAPLEPLDEVRGVSLLVLNGKQQGALYVDGLTYDPDVAGRKAAVLINDLQSDDMEARDRAEKALVVIGRPASELLYQVAADERPEVLLRAASALKQIEAIPEVAPADPKVKGEVEKQREELQFDESRRRAEYVLHGLEAERARLLSLAQEAQSELAMGRTGLDALKFIEMDKRKAYAEVLQKIDGLLKELKPLVDLALEQKKLAAEKKAAEDKKKAEELKATMDDLKNKN
jgi:hypothetical protein